MKFKTVKRSHEVLLDGIKVELDVVDNSVKGVTLTDASGHVVRISERAYCMQVEVPAPPETEKKFQLSGEVIGLPVAKTFDSRYEAEDEMRRLKNDAAHAELKVDEVDVEIPF